MVRVRGVTLIQEMLRVAAAAAVAKGAALERGPPPLWTTLKPGPEDSGTAKQLGRDTRCSPKSSCSHGNTTATPRQREPQGSSKSKPQDRSSHTEPCKELKVAQTC